MSANTKVSVAAVSGLRKPDKMIATFERSIGGVNMELVHVADYIEGYGRDPSTAIVEIPLGGFNAYAVADALHGSRVKIDGAIADGSGNYALVRILNAKISRDNSVIKPGHNSLQLTVADDRVDLDAYKVAGRIALNEAGTDHKFQLSEPSLFNPGGLRNRGKTTDGKVVITAYPEWKVNGSDGAENFSLADIFEYFITWYCDFNFIDTNSAYYPFLMPFPSDVIIPQGFGAAIDQNSWNGGAFQQGNSSTGTNRNGREFSIDGVPFTEWMDALLEGTGFTWTLSPCSDQKNLIQLVPLRASQVGAYIVPLNDVTYGPDEVQFEFNSEQKRTQVTVLGLPVEIEDRASTHSGSLTLKAAWTAEDLTKAGNFISLDINKTPEGEREMFDFIAPRLFQAYKIADQDWLAGTIFEGFPHLGIYYIKEHLNSLQERSNNTDFAPFYYPIIVEVETSSGTWETVTELTGREIMDDGTILLPILRQHPDSTKRNWDYTDDTPYNAPLVAKNIRFTSVIFGDARLNMTAWQAGLISKIGGNFASPVDYDPEVDRLVPGFRRGEIIDSRLYAFQIRKSTAKPIPESSPGATSSGNYTAPTFGGATLRNDAQKALQHARKIMWERSVHKSGQMVYEGRVFDIHQGATISKFVDKDGNEFRANAIVTGKRIQSLPNATRTIVYFGTKRSG
jgi:hypothetical protein